MKAYVAEKVKFAIIENAIYVLMKTEDGTVEKAYSRDFYKEVIAQDNVLMLKGADERIHRVFLAKEEVRRLF